jgi:hypothetical protein
VHRSWIAAELLDGNSSSTAAYVIGVGDVGGQGTVVKITF